MDMRDMSDIGSLFGTGKDEQRTSPEEPGWCNTLTKDLCYRDI